MKRPTAMTAGVRRAMARRPPFALLASVQGSASLAKAGTDAPGGARLVGGRPGCEPLAASGDASRHVSGDASGHVTGDASGQITGDASRHVTGDASRHVSGDAPRQVTGDASGHVTGDASRHASGTTASRIVLTEHMTRPQRTAAPQRTE
jgi:hypothetical protein